MKRSRRVHPLCFLLFWSSTQLAAGEVKLDLSHKHFLGVQRLKEAIQESIDEKPRALHVDISSSLFGDEVEVDEILKTLLPSPDGSHSHTTGLAFVARGNRMTPRSMDGLFRILLNSSSSAINTTTTEEGLNKNESMTNSTLNESTTTTSAIPWRLDYLDAGWNGLQQNAPGWKGFLKSLRELLQTPEVCPSTIRLERCGLSPGACRAMGKGIIQRFKSDPNKASAVENKPLSLHLCGNPDLGDSGIAAIAAAIRTVNKESSGTTVVLDTLDLSACGITNAGAEALSVALESGMCIRHLDLSNNQLSDVGATAIAHALLSGGGLETLDLSGNKDIKDEAATAIAEAVGKGLISCIRMRSCHILADGAAAFGKAVANLAQREHDTPVGSIIEIDLSGNPLGVLRGKAKSGGKYSASAIKSKATATTAAYVSMLQKGIKRGLKEYGVADAFGSNLESDDEEESRSGMEDEMMGGDDLDPSKARCGIKAFANPVLDEQGGKASGLVCKIGLRRCFLDHGAADALAAVVVHSKDDLQIDLSFDLDMNPVLEEEMIEAIEGSETQDDLLRDMSERYQDALEALREARERAAEAARAAAARMQAEREMWDPPSGLDEDWRNDAYDDDEWDSDADYEEDEEEPY